jgi:hypothetical protein
VATSHRTSTPYPGLNAAETAAALQGENMLSLIKPTAIIALALFTFFGQVVVVCNLVAAPFIEAMVTLDSTKPQ